MESESQTLAINLTGDHNVGASVVAAVSIAISLKRIADQIEGVAYDYTPGADNSQHRVGLVDAIAVAIEQAIIGAARTR